jgi:hypothetical protein
VDKNPRYLRSGTIHTSTRDLTTNMTIRLAHPTDIESVLALQARYLFAHLNDEERKDGFQTTPFTSEQIRSIMAQDGLFTAWEGAELCGYAYAGEWSFWAQWPIFPYMMSLFPQMMWRGAPLLDISSFQYGPVCIDGKWRGKGVLPQLFEGMRQVWVKKHPLSLTFINQINERSLVAHTRKLGWDNIGTFQFNGNSYYFLAYDMERAVEIG